MDIGILEALKQVTTSIKKWVDDNKVAKVSGKGLSTNDYTAADKQKVENIPNDLVVDEDKLYLAQDGVPIENSAVAYLKKTSQLINDSGFITVDDLPEGGGIIIETDPTVPDWAKEATKPIYTAKEVGALPADTVIPTSDDIRTEVETALANEYGVVFDDFPTEEQIRALPNNSYFTIRGLNTTYRKVNYWVSNGLLYTNPNDENDKIYIFPVDQPEGEIYLPYYGIKPGSGNAENNSIIMDKLTRQANAYGVAYGSTFKLPAGNFYFSRPIDLVNQPFSQADSNGNKPQSHYSLLGVTNVNHKNDKIGITFLHFPNLAEGETALTVAQCTVADFVICGTSNQYTVTVKRENAKTDVNTVFQESVTVKAYGMKTDGYMVIRNVGFKHFYYGCWCENSNAFINDTSFHNCHYGLSVGTDIKVNNIFGANIMTLLQLRRSISSAVGVRGDSVGKHLVEILGGSSHTLVDLDADFCMDSIVAIGDGTNSCNVSSLSITGTHGRAGVRHMYPASGEEVTANDIVTNTVGEFGVVAVKNGATLNGAIITTNQEAQQDPYDKASGYYLPFVLLSAGSGTIVKNVQIFSTSYTGNELTEDWVKNRVSSLSSLPDACLIKIQTGSGSITYKKDNGLVTVTDDATDIYQRMDKSALALNGEVVKTINGIQPDDNGNIDIIEEEPEVVGSLAECIDTSKKYVLPDGYIYAYRKKFVPGTKTPNFTNQLPLSLDPVTQEGILDGVGYKDNVIYYSDVNNYVQNITEHTVYEAIPNYDISTRWATGLIPVKKGDTVRINAMGYSTGTGVPFLFLLVDQSGSLFQEKIWKDRIDRITNGRGEYTLSGSGEGGILSDVKININGDTFPDTLPWGEAKYIWFSILDSTPPEDVVITVNEEIAYIETEDHYEWNWENTGEQYYAVDYLSMINELDSRVDVLGEDMPTKTSELENDSGFITAGDVVGSGVYVGVGELPDGYNIQINPDGDVATIPTKTSELENDCGFITLDDIPDGNGGTITETDSDIPDYWQTALDEGVKAINTAMMTAGCNKSAFLFYSDSHWNDGSQMSPKLLKYLYQHTAMTKTNFGGDIVNDETTDYEDMSYLWDWRNQLKDLPNHHSVVGEYDRGKSTYFNEQYVYGYLLAAEETPDIVRGNSGLYYYIDHPSEKTRYLYLNTAYLRLGDKQQAFVKDALLSTPDGWHIIAISHIWHVIVYNGSVRNVGKLNANASILLSMFDSYNLRTGDYSECGGWVEFCIGGHTHLDYDSTSSTGIPIILVATDSQHIGDDASFTLGTDTEASVNGIIADYGNHKIYVVRIGRGESREIEMTNYVVNYTNLLPKAISLIDTNSILTGEGTVGYLDKTRWSSSGNAYVSSDVVDTSGLIPGVQGDTVYLKDVTMYIQSDLVHGGISFYDANKAYITGVDLTNDFGEQWNVQTDERGDITQFTIPDWNNGTEYFSISCQDIKPTSIITVNDPIE